jgi:3-hydroxyacyl-[acyl-carrier-protein] dehydratase
MEESPVRFELVDINEILKTLPHRFPMLLIDRVIKIRTDYSGIGIKNVTFNEPFFQGHFPDKPVMPGVLLLEGMAQTGGCICALLLGKNAATSVVYFLTIDKAKFRRPVVPGDVLEYHMTKVTRRKSMWWYRGEAKVAGELVAEAMLGAMIVDK